jgi:hypothetical protein
VRDGRPNLRHAAGVGDLWISADGSSYAVEEPNGPWGAGSPTLGFDDRVVDDSPRSKDHGQILPPVFISPNGKHYGYTLFRQWGTRPGQVKAWMKAVVDRHVKRVLTDLQGGLTRAVLQVTSGGHYTTCDEGGYPYLDTRRYHGQCPIYISDDARHVLVEGHRWTLGGRPISVSPRYCDEVDLDHGMLYTYRTTT